MTLILTENEGAITTITLNRPEKLNAMFGTMREELIDAIATANESAATRVVVITGAGRGFCAGGDVEYMQGLQQRQDISAFRKLLDAGRDVVTRIRSSEKFFIAAINGVAAGAGCSLALACDYRIAAETAKLGQTFVKIGLHPDWGGTFFLPRLIGTSRALEILATGRMVDAEEAEALGMIDRVVTHEELISSANALAKMVAAGPSIAIAAVKRAVYASEKRSLESQLDLETEHQTKAFQSSDSGEGMRAFFEKRAPEFRGN
ncbi:MAG TPA: enoyl-CoA hydratase-related protein [Thermoanaerobaculia bacterium]|nr:enoyl-CoA hydratase-related protein [Thermoanaerobaculia bacterium]